MIEKVFLSTASNAKNCKFTTAQSGFKDKKKVDILYNDKTGKNSGKNKYFVWPILFNLILGGPLS